VISWKHLRRPNKAMKNGVIIYLEDTEGGNIRVLGEVVGNPDQSKDLADELLVKLMVEAHRHLMVYPPTSLQ
jgi:hypothetical protein